MARAPLSACRTPRFARDPLFCAAGVHVRIRTPKCKVRVLGPGVPGGGGSLLSLLARDGCSGKPHSRGKTPGARNAMTTGVCPVASPLFPWQRRETAIGKEGGQTSARRQAQPGWQAPAESQARFTGLENAGPSSGLREGCWSTPRFNDDFAPHADPSPIQS